MARGLKKQLDRCPSSNRQPTPDSCSFPVVYNNVKNAYNSLWDAIEENKDYLSDEVWSWVYKDGEFIHAPLGSLPPPPGAGGVAESDIVQLWSLTFLAVIRNEGMRQWSTGLGFDGPTKKACPVLGLSRPMDKPIAKRGIQWSTGLGLYG